MQYIALKDRLKGFTVFSLSDIRKLEDKFYRRRLTEWQDKGYIKKLTKGYYIFSDLKIGEEVLFEIANRIYAPSYISSEMALSRYGLIPESIYGITSVSTRKTCTFRTKIASFIYRTVKAKLFFGYTIAESDGKKYKIASCEKAILDYLYLNPAIRKRADFENMRLSRENFYKVTNERTLTKYLERFDNKALKKRLHSLMEFVKDA